MTKMERTFNLISDNPSITNKEIGEEVGLGRSGVHTYISRLKEQGYIDDIDLDGKREFKILRDFKKVEPKSFKAMVYGDMVETFLIDFECAEGYLERLEIGRMIVKLLEKI